MSLFPDLIPKYDGTQDIGETAHRWRTLFARYLQDGATVIPVADIATKADIAALSVLPTVTSADNGRYLGVKTARWAVVDAPPGVLPIVSESDNGKFLTVYSAKWAAMRVQLLPPVSAADNGMILKVVSANWTAVAPPPSLPTVGPSDEGKLLQVVSAKWAAVNPPSDVLPTVTLADHGSVLIALNGQWNRRIIGLATTSEEGFAPKLPGSPGLLLSGANTWVPSLTGASGQWKIGDIKATARSPEYGWLECDGSAIDTGDDRYSALYRVLGGTDEGWANGDPVTLPNIPGSRIRYLPDSKAPAEFGLVLDVPGTSIAGAKVHFELELYRSPRYQGTPVLAGGTLAEIHPALSFDTPIGEVTSRSPGWFWHDAMYSVWRLFRSEGETAAANAGLQVLVDLAELPFSSLQRERMTPGSYYYRYRQLTVSGSVVLVTGGWRYGRVLSTGGMNREENLLSKLCDVFIRGTPRTWKPPVSCASVSAVSLNGLLSEGSGLTVAPNGDVTVNAPGTAGERISLVGQGHLMNRSDEWNWLDQAAVIPQYSVCRARPLGVSFVELEHGQAATGWSAILPARTGGADRATEMILLGLSTGGQRLAVSNRIVSALGTFTMRGGLSYADLYKPSYGYASGSGHSAYIPPRNDIYCYRLDRTGMQAGEFPPGLDVLSVAWQTPYFHAGVHFNGIDYLIPGEADCVMERESGVSYPIPSGKIFKGGAAPVLGADGRIYCLPRYTWQSPGQTTSTGALIFDPPSGSIDFIPVPWSVQSGTKPDSSGWRCGVLLRDGRILFVPWTESTFVILDPMRRHIFQTDFGLDLKGAGRKWEKAFVMSDGTVCGFGTGVTGWETTCFRFNPEDDTCVLFQFPWPIGDAIRAGCAMPDGGILLAPYTPAGATRWFIASAGAPPFSPGTASPILVGG